MAPFVSILSSLRSTPLAKHSYKPLPTDCTEEIPSPVRCRGQCRENASWKFLFKSLLFVSVAFNIISGYLWMRDDDPGPSPPTLLYSPAQEAVKYMTVKFHRGLFDDVPLYEAIPTPSQDEAWMALWSSPALKVSEAEARLMVNSTWEIPSEKGHFMTTLDVFHQLHCLDTIRQAAQPRYYPEFHTPLKHIRHCVGAIRQALMCFSDITPVVWQWSEKLNMLEQRDDVPHTCRDFNKISDWAKARKCENGACDL